MYDPTDTLEQLMTAAENIVDTCRNLLTGAGEDQNIEVTEETLKDIGLDVSQINSMFESLEDAETEE